MNLFSISFADSSPFKSAPEAKTNNHKCTFRHCFNEKQKPNGANIRFFRRKLEGLNGSEAIEIGISRGGFVRQGLRN